MLTDSTKISNNVFIKIKSQKMKRRFLSASQIVAACLALCFTSDGWCSSSSSSSQLSWSSSPMEENQFAFTNHPYSSTNLFQQIFFTTILFTTTNVQEYSGLTGANIKDEMWIRKMATVIDIYIQHFKPFRR